MAIGDAMQALEVLHFRGKQEEAVEAVLSGADVFYVFPTGCGKSIVYQVAALCSDGVTIIVSPLLGLLNEQLAKMSSLGVCVMGACGGTLDAYNGTSGYKMVYTTPEQVHEGSELCKHLEKEQVHVARVVVDEAHVIQDWEDFRYAALKWDGGEVCEARKCGMKNVCMQASLCVFVEDDREVESASCCMYSYCKCSGRKRYCAVFAHETSSVHQDALRMFLALLM
jgi:hypothetical protein